MKIGFVADSTVDLPDHILEEKSITIIPLYIHIGDHDFLDKVEMSRENFYANLSSFSHHPVTAVPGIDIFLKAYQTQIKRGNTAIFSFHLSNVLSKTVGVAQIAAQRIHNVPVYVIDSGNISMGTGLLLQMAVKMAESGEREKEIIKAVKDAVKRTHTVVILDTIEYLRRSGRIPPNIQLGWRNLLFTKPIIRMNNEKIELERIHTKKSAMHHLIQILEEFSPFQDLAFIHTHALDKVEKLKMNVSGLIPADREILIGEITPVIGAHIGPGVFGFSVITSK